MKTTVLRGALCALWCSMPLMLDGIIIRLSIMEKAELIGTQRITLFHDLHKADPTTADQQRSALERLYVHTAPGTSIVLEMPERQHMPLFTELQDILYTCASSLRHLCVGTPSLKNMASLGARYYERGPINQQLLYRLAEHAIPDLPYTTPDLRSLIATIFDLSLIAAMTPYAPSISHDLENALGACTLTTQDVFALIDKLLTTTHAAVLKAYTWSTNTDTRAVLADLYYVLTQYMALYDGAQETWHPACHANFITEVLRQAETHAALNLPVPDHCALTLGEPLFDLIINLTANDLMLWLADGPMLANLLNPKDRHSKILIIGASHAEHMMGLLEREGFTTEYDSRITVTALPTTFSSFDEALLAINNQCTGMQSLLATLYATVVPLDDKLFDYYLKSTEELHNKLSE